MSEEELMKNASLLLFFNQVAQMKLQLKSDGIELDTESALEGARRALAGEEVGVPMDKIQSVMSQMQTKVLAIRAKKQKEMAAQQKEMEAQLKELAAANKMEGEKYLAENAKKEGVKTLDGGVQYEVMVAGTGPKPKPTDRVRINYHGTFIDGKVFDSTVSPPNPQRPAKPYEANANVFVDGFNTAIQAMPVGSKWKISIPSDQAYKMGRAGGIPPNKTLIFEVELLDILTEKAAPAGK